MNENTYIVEKKDNLYSLAKKFKTTIGTLKALNNLESNILLPGDILKIPIAIIEQKKPNDYIIYTIKKGDNLYDIAKKYNITLQDLVNFNEKATTMLQIGDQILIPIKNNNDNLTYVVKPKDTLYNIAKRYDIDVNNLMNINNLKDNIIQIGQELIIPNTSNYQTYVVRTNDTIESIANKFNIKADDIKRINNQETNDIVIGQILLIPKRML